MVFVLSADLLIDRSRWKSLDAVEIRLVVSAKMDARDFTAGFSSWSDGGLPIAAPESFVPIWWPFVCYGLFYWAGWQLFGHEVLLDRLQPLCWPQVLRRLILLGVPDPLADYPLFADSVDSDPVTSLG